MPSDFLNMTLAQFLVWLMTFGIAAGIAYVLGWFPNLDPNVKNFIQVVAVAVLVAGVNALGTFIPADWLNLKLLDLVFKLLSLVLGLGVAVGGLKYGAFKAVSHRAELSVAKADLGE